MSRKTILLLNPSGRLPYTRDYFCSKVTKTGYIEHPVDLLILSGILYQHHSLILIDAIAQNLDFENCYQKICALNIDAIIFLAGCVSWKDDFEFLKKIKAAKPQVLFIGIGDIFKKENIFRENAWIDANLKDFTSHDIVEYLEGKNSAFLDLAYRKNGSLVIPPERKNENSKILFEVPIPRHEMFLKNSYTFPFVKNLPYTTVLTDYGCGFNCAYCIYSSFGFKMRALQNVYEELEYIHSLGIKELFVKDQTFAFDRKRGIELCREMIRKKWGFSWTCFLRANVVTVELLSLMKEAGCHTASFGVESGNDEILRIYRTGVDKERIKKALLSRI